jgi:hypothetical protein
MSLASRIADLAARVGAEFASRRVRQVTVQFGAVPVRSHRATIPMVGALPGQTVVMVPAADLAGDELEMDTFVCAARVITPGQIDAFITAVPGPVVGSRRFNLSLGAA